MFVESELNCSDCRCYNCTVVECGRSLCAGKVNASYRTFFHDCFSSRCTYNDALVEASEPEPEEPLPFLYAGDDSDEPEDEEF